MVVYNPNRYVPDPTKSKEERMLEAIEYVAQSIVDIQQRLAVIEQKLAKKSGGAPLI